MYLSSLGQNGSLRLIYESDGLSDMHHRLSGASIENGLPHTSENHWSQSILGTNERLPERIMGIPVTSSLTWNKINHPQSICKCGENEDVANYACKLNAAEDVNMNSTIMAQFGFDMASSCMIGNYMRTFLQIIRSLQHGLI